MMRLPAGVTDFVTGGTDYTKDTTQGINDFTSRSGVRCEKHNKAVGGAPKSQHVLKNAADIKVRGVKPEVVQAYLIKKYPDSLGIGLYNSFVHVDVRPWKARWDLSDKGKDQCTI